MLSVHASVTLLRHASARWPVRQEPGEAADSSPNRERGPRDRRCLAPMWDEPGPDWGRVPDSSQREGLIGC
jgi:hypothetical protein